MACVLSMSALYQSQYNGNIADIQNVGFKYVDFNWINQGCQHSRFQDNHIYCGQCQIDTVNTGTGSTSFCQLTIGNGKSGIVTHGAQLNTEVSDKKDLTNGDTDCFGKLDYGIPLDMSKPGVKRKSLTDDCGEVYIPAKRVSPFLNTPKERKDERKKILRISMKKIKELDNPETFLRRSVLLNNLTKNLQTELRQEKHSSRKFSSYKGKYFNDTEVLNNNCLSDTYLFDDPFLSGTHEAITDDMTDTLINNVLNDNKSNETKVGFDS